MARANRILAYTCVKSEGSILPYDLLARVAAADRTLDGVKPEDYHLGPSERFGEVVSRSWSRLTGAWKSLRESLEKLSKDDPALRVTRERFLLPLFQELGYGRLQTTTALEVGGKSYAISHLWQHTPIHLLGWGVDLDKRQRGVAGAAQSSPHGLVQDLLNRSDAHLWGMMSNGRTLRLLRDHQSLTRQAYVEFDLESMFDGELYAEFLLLWLVCHESRVEADKPSSCWLEKWFQTSRVDGVQAHTKLRQGVEAAICALGSGLVQHPKSEALRQALQSGALTPLELYRQILRVVYRLLFVLVAEDRGALHPPATPDQVRKRYQNFYSLRRLRDLAAARRGGPHADLWRQLCLVHAQLIEGYDPLGLPALGSYLWSHEAAPWPMESVCSNQLLLAAITHLTTVPADKGRGRLPVNFRTLGAEELGSIYEGLLELQPVVHAETGQFELGGSQGNERKTSGSYYTPSSLVDCLLDSALDPVLEEACKKPDSVAALLDLKIVDPACGSGHFLVAAARRLAKRLAAARSGDDEPSPEAVQHALRDVIGRCIYGVDLNPMAVELCKVALWVEALEPGRPLSFLEAHIQCGNSLLGATPELLGRRDDQGRWVGIPDEAFVALEGDDKKVTSALKKQNKEARAYRTLLARRESTALDFDVLRTQMSAVANADDASLAEIRSKASAFAAYLASPEYRRAKLQADAWCAAFVWKKVPGAPVLTNAEYLPLREGAELPALVREEVERLAAEYQFFHWHLAFPEVFDGQRPAPAVLPAKGSAGPGGAGKASAGNAAQLGLTW